MATRRTQIEIVVLGLEELRKVNTALGTHQKRLESLLDTQNKFHSAARQTADAFGQQGKAAKSASESIQQQTKSLKEAEKATGGLRRGNENLLQSLLKLRGVEEIIGGMATAFRESAKAALEYEKQAARISRVLGVSSKGLFSAAMRADTARTGKTVEEVGEAYYQLGTFVKETDALFSAHKTTMDLVIGTESNVRDTARAVVSVYNQYGEQLDKTASKAENFRRIGELFALSFTNSNTEINELTESLKYLSPIATAAKVPLEQVFALIGGLDKGGLRGSLAGTSIAQFIANLIKKYDHELGGIVKGDKLFKFDFARTADGGMDLLQTLKNVFEIVNRLPVEKAEKFMQAISGSQQAFRVTGELKAIKELMPDIEKGIAQAGEALKGTTTEAEKLRKTMENTVSHQLARTWQSTLGVMSDAWEKFASGIHLKGMLRDIANANEAWLNLTKLEEQRTLDLNGDKRANIGFQRNSLINLLSEVKGDRISDAVYMTTTGGEGMISQIDRERLWKFLKERGVSRQMPDKWFGIPGDTYIERTDAEKLLKDIDVEFRALKPKVRPSASPGVSSSTTTNAGEAIASHLRDAVETPQFQASCAYFASAIMKKAGLNVPNIGSASGLRDYLVSKGAKPVTGMAEAQPGDYALFHGKGYGTWKDGAGKGYHAGIYAGEGRIRQSSNGIVSERTLSAAEKKAATFYRVPDSLLMADGAIAFTPDALKAQAAEAERKRKAKEAEHKRAQAAVEKMQREAAQKLQDEREAATSRAEALYLRNKERYGIYDKRTQDAANEADRRALLSERGDPLERLKLGIGGSRKDLRRDLKDAASDTFHVSEGLFGMTFPKEMQENLQKQREQIREMFAEMQNGNVSLLLERNTSTIRGYQNGVRPNSMFGDQDVSQRLALSATVNSIRDTITELSKIAFPTKDTTDRLKELREELEETETSIRDLDDQMQRNRIEQRFEQIGRDAATGFFDIDMAQKPVLSDQQWRQEMQQTRQEIAVLDKQIAARNNALTGKEWMELSPDAKQRIDQETLNLERERDIRHKRTRDIPQERYLQIFEQVRSDIVQNGVGFLRGRNGIGDVFKAGGNRIVDTILERQVQTWTDPMVQSIARNVAATEGLTTALKEAKAVISGEYIPKQSGEANSKKSKIASNARTQQAIAAALGGYSLFSQGAEQGVSLGGAAGSAISGGSLFSGIKGVSWLAGAGIGLGLNLLGSLFGGGKKKDPLEESKNYNPSIYNAPSDLVYQALQYRVTGQLPTAEQIGLTLNQQPAPVVNLYAVIDGVSKKVKAEMSNQTKTGRVTETNATFNLHEIV